MATMSKTQLIDELATLSELDKKQVKTLLEGLVTVAVKELAASGQFVVPGLTKLTVTNKPATAAREGINPFTKEPMTFAAKPASKAVKASALKVLKDAV